jgi:hypothetical protein
MIGAVTAQSGGTLRTSWGEPDLMGVWVATNVAVTPGKDPLNLAQLEGLYRPDARAAMKRMSEKDDPALHCTPYSYPRYVTSGLPFQIGQGPRAVLIFNQANHSYRYVPTGGKPHQGVFPSYQGDSEGRWEGDTLVVDVDAFNGKTWLADGKAKPTSASTGVWPTSDALHVVERWRRVDASTLEYQATIEDSKMLTAAWTMPKITLKRAPVRKIAEGICLDNSSYAATGDDAAR